MFHLHAEDDASDWLLPLTKGGGQKAEASPFSTECLSPRGPILVLGETQGERALVSAEGRWLSGLPALSQVFISYRSVHAHLPIPCPERGSELLCTAGSPGGGRQPLLEALRGDRLRDREPGRQLHTVSRRGGVRRWGPSQGGGSCRFEKRR